MVDPKLDGWRGEIDQIDQEILLKLAKRKEVSAKVMQWKQENNVPLLDTQREEELILLLKKSADPLGLDEAFVQKLYQIILEDAKSS